MNDIIVFIGIGIMLIAVVVAYQYASIKFSKQLSSFLYKEFDANKYLEILDSSKAKLFVRKNRREMLKLDGYAVKQDSVNLEKQLIKLESMKISYGQKISLYEKEVQYYANSKQNDKALKAYDELMILGNQINSNDMSRVLNEATITIEVYVKRNGELAEKLVELAKNNKTPIIKGLYFYKASKCFYYNDDKINVIKYLKKAQNNLTSKIWRDHIDACLKDFKQLDEK
jgi:hypothetical protein